VKLSKLPSKRFKTLTGPTWCAKPSLYELLQRQELVSVTRLACGQPRLLGREANETKQDSAAWPTDGTKTAIADTIRDLDPLGSL
jgi:hypothetical protein